MKLYTYYRSSAAFRVRIALNLKGLKYDSVPKLFAKNEHRAADYLSVNPQGLIPALDIDGAVLSQSMAIMEYLDEKHPEPAFLPADAIGRARVRSMALSIVADLHPINNLRVLNYLRRELKQDDDGVNTWYRHWVTEGFRSLEQLAGTYSKSGRYCYGDSVSLADICLVPQVFNAKRFDCPLDDYPTVMRIYEACEKLPAFAAAHPSKQPDAA